MEKDLSITTSNNKTCETEVNNMKIMSTNIYLHLSTTTTCNNIQQKKENHVKHNTVHENERIRKKKNIFMYEEQD